VKKGGRGRISGRAGGRDHILHTQLELPRPLDTVFSFFAAAENLERITPPELRFKILTPMPVEMGLGTLLDYRLSLFGVPFRWHTEIAEWNPPHAFVDVQLSGPYALWVHTHTFAETDKGALIDDHVRYRLPLSPLGELAFPMIRRQLARIFLYRQAAVRAALLGPTAAQEPAGEKATMRRPP
jgi:ligand-binding SRPBCC domain-containing protein